jgi:hypothetical protein
LTSLWTAYKNAHTDIRKDDDGGNWDQAVEKAIGSGGNTSNTAFAAFNKESGASLSAVSDLTRADLTDARNGLPPIAWLGLPIGIAAALLIVWGMSQRLEEYR